ncbi:hypothetical protein [Shinella sp.]|uniref:hypothetical protein n=1 Tax=Shinella sp. TaxID=1870904 RepID=UPI0028A7F679|nr:hypothetical protein [Shinella sp.]
MNDLKPFLDDMLSMSTGTDGRTLEIHFSRPVTKEDRQAFADAHNAIVRGQLIGWQPMETAPRDWTNIILFDDECDPPVFEGYFSMEDGGRNCWMENQGMGSEPVNPSRWMPLPAAPTASDTNADPCRAPLCDCSMGAAERCGRPGGAADPTRASGGEQ